MTTGTMATARLRLEQQLDAGPVRYLWVWAIFAGTCTPVFCVVAVAVLAQFVAMDTSEFVLAVLISTAGLLLAFALACREMFRLAAPWTRWVRAGRPLAGAPEAWPAPHGLAQPLMLGLLLRALLLAATPLSVFLALESHLSGGSAALVAVGLLIAASYPTLGGFFVFSAFVRVPAREVARALPAAEIVARGPQLRRTLLLGIPLAAAASTVLVSVVVTDEEGHSLVALERAMAFTGAVTVTASLALAWLLTRSLLRPIEDLVDAARQVHSGAEDVRVPLTAGGELGALSHSFNRVVDAFAEREREQELAARLEDELRAERSAGELAAQTALARERERIARDLHDVVCQKLSTMVLQAGGGQGLVATDADRARASAGAIGTLGREALVELREFVTVLRGSEAATLAPQPGVGDLAALIRSIRSDTLDIELRLDDDHANGISADVSLCTYRIVQEALTNVVKHSGAGQAVVSVRRRPGSVEIEIDDDGHAVAGASAAPGSSHGVIGMRERAALFGGELDARPRPDGSGFRVRAVLPYGEPA